MYITGGIGATNSGEAFTNDYDLPNDTNYSETCASIGLIFHNIIPDCPAGCKQFFISCLSGQICHGSIHIHSAFCMSHCLFLQTYRTLELIVIIIRILIIIPVWFRCSGFLPKADMVSLFKFFLKEVIGSSGIDKISCQI